MSRDIIIMQALFCAGARHIPAHKQVKILPASLSVNTFLIHTSRRNTVWPSSGMSSTEGMTIACQQEQVSWLGRMGNRRTSTRKPISIPTSASASHRHSVGFACGHPKGLLAVSVALIPHQTRAAPTHAIPTS